MARPKPFAPVKLICGVIHAEDGFYDEARARLAALFGDVDLESPALPFDLTDYYNGEMGPGQRRRFMSFTRLVDPQDLPRIKLLTNDLERTIGAPAPGRRAVNLDPGYLTSSALVMATAKDFSHRIPLRDGIYAHLELLFARKGIRALDWTYPDLRREPPQAYFRAVRDIYLRQLRGRRA